MRFIRWKKSKCKLRNKICIDFNGDSASCENFV